jgi:glycosyltransferase involved in cell wall biosynthesis
MPWWPSRRDAPVGRAAILVPSLRRGDAVGNDALGMREVLVKQGCDARLFADSSDPSLGASPIAAARASLDDPSLLVVLHHAARWDVGVKLFERARGPRVVRDHNVTPDWFFAGVSAEHVDASRLGAQQRARLARDGGVRLLLAASERNAGELAGLGAEPGRIAVVPPFHRAEELAVVDPDPGTLRSFGKLPPTALFVGRLAPNKGHRRLLRVAATYAELFSEPLHLRFAGVCDPRFAPWLEVLRRDAKHFGLDGRVEILGFVTESQLKAAYLTSHVFLCLSEHEGFCVPLVEAARLGVPVVAAYEPAVADTLGPIGLVLDGAGDDAVAVAVHRVLHDAALRDALVAAQRARFEGRFSRTAIEAAFLRATAPLLGRASERAA